MLILVIGIICLIVAIIGLIGIFVVEDEKKPRFLIVGIICFIVGMVIVFTHTGDSGSYEDTYTNSPQYYEDGYNYYHNNPDAWQRDFGDINKK